MKHHETNQRSGQRVQKFIEQVHEKASFLASQSQTTVWAVDGMRFTAPLREEIVRWNPWKQGLTRTHTRCRLAALAWKA